MSVTDDIVRAIACFGPVGQSLAEHLDAPDLLSLSTAIPGMAPNRQHIWPIAPFLRPFFQDPLRVLQLCDGEQAFCSGLGILHLMRRTSNGAVPVLVASAKALPSIIDFLEAYEFEMLSVLDWATGVGCLQPELWQPSNTSNFLACLRAQAANLCTGQLPFRAIHQGRNVPLDHTVSPS